MQKLLLSCKKFQLSLLLYQYSTFFPIITRRIAIAVIIIAVPNGNEKKRIDLVMIGPSSDREMLSVAVYCPRRKSSFHKALGITRVEPDKMFTLGRSSLPMLCPNMFFIIICPFGFMK